MMQTHDPIREAMLSIRVDLLNAETCQHGSVTVRSRTPIFAMARKLIALGYDPGCLVQTFTATGTPSIRGTLGALAGMTVHDAAGGERFAKWQAHPRIRHAVSSITLAA